MLWAMLMPLEQLSLNTSNYSAVIIARSDISSVNLTYLMVFDEGALLQKALTTVVHILCQ